MREFWRIRVQRRSVLGRILMATGGVAAGPWLWTARPAWAQPEQLTVSGGGVNVKEMPGLDGAMVPLRESFSFDANYAQCIIEDNPAAIAMDTHTMGHVVIEPHAFFMAMYSHEMSLVSIRRAPDGKRVARLAGQLGCATYAGTATTTVGSRTELEPALFEIEAVDGGQGGGAAGDSFAFTVFFDPGQAPLNFAIFGPRPTFTGELVAGEVTIAPPVVRPLLP